MSWTAADLPTFAGRTVIVTGANSGLGLVTARELARVAPTSSWPAATPRRVRSGRDDAGSVAEVRPSTCKTRRSQGVRERADEVDVLDQQRRHRMAVPYALTKDGFESR